MNTLKRVWLSTTFTLASLASGTHSALAESATFGGPMPPIPGTPNGADETSIRDAILKVLTFVLNFLALLAVIFIIIAGIRLIVSPGGRGDQGKGEKDDPLRHHRLGGGAVRTRHRRPLHIDALEHGERAIAIIPYAPRKHPPPAVAGAFFCALDDRRAQTLSSSACGLRKNRRGEGNECSILRMSVFFVAIGIRGEDVYASAGIDFRSAGISFTGFDIGSRTEVSRIMMLSLRTSTMDESGSAVPHRSIRRGRATPP